MIKTKYFMVCRGNALYISPEVEAECVNESIMSNCVLSNKFDEYKNLFQMVLEGDFTPETSMFTGYDTLPVWKEQREKFVSQYNIKIIKIT